MQQSKETRVVIIDSKNPLEHKLYEGKGFYWILWGYDAFRTVPGTQWVPDMYSLNKEKEGTT